MDKKDIYEHLAKIYLDASSKKKQKARTYTGLFRNLLLASIVLVLMLTSVLAVTLKKNRPFDSEVALVLLHDTAKINFNFDPAKKEIYSINVSKLNLAKFKTLVFSAKKVDSSNKVALKVEVVSAFKERSELYFRDIPVKWTEYKINFADFHGISDWSAILNLGFAVEQWNTQKKNGIIYIENVRLLK